MKKIRKNNTKVSQKDKGNRQRKTKVRKKESKSKETRKKHK